VGEADYERDLGAAVVGQPQAVAAAASQLDAIKSGLPDPGKPASVMLFAGLTGVGKTELAKTLARFYSSSKRLQTYTMANFTQPHSVSGIVGVPPGYVGHEQGGRLVNDLNSDPYCVFLLDEAEKAHPDIWKLFLTCSTRRGSSTSGRSRRLPTGPSSSSRRTWAPTSSPAGRRAARPRSR
jgi:ATP-dependent Clp protease ATP-binding subunit ClpA